MGAFIILGRDKRYEYLCGLLEKKGKVTTEFEAGKYEHERVVVFPFNAGEEQHLETISRLFSGEAVVVGRATQYVREKANEKNIRIKELLCDKSFLKQNSISTAEGALAEIILKTPRKLNGQRILILGYGNVGSEVAKLFRSCGGIVTVTSRERGIKAAADEGFETISLEENNLKDYEIVINTIPAPVLNAAKIAGLSSDAIVMELASGSKNIDLNAIALYKIQFINAQGLPGIYTPLSEAEEMSRAITEFLNESE